MDRDMTTVKPGYSSVTVRPFRAEDTPRLVEVMARTFGEYGMRFEPDGYDRDVLDAATRYGGPDAAFFAAEVEGRAAGFVGGDIPRPGVVEVHRLYIDPAARGLGLGAALCGAIEGWAGTRADVVAIELWSDVRFAHAHAMYLRRGFGLMRAGQRTLSDPDRSVEFGFRRPHASGALGEVRRLPLEEMMADPVRAHRARMVVAAVMDSRALVRAGRMVAGGHQLPEAGELFGGRVPEFALEVGEGVIVGFEAAGEGRRVHPTLVKMGMSICS